MNEQIVVRRIKLAKRRALYWSGIPSFNPHARAKRENDEKYEIALDDVHSLTSELAKLRGQTPPNKRDYNPKRDFAARWNRLKVHDDASVEKRGA